MTLNIVSDPYYQDCKIADMADIDVPVGTKSLLSGDTISK